MANPFIMHKINLSEKAKKITISLKNNVFLQFCTQDIKKTLAVLHLKYRKSLAVLHLIYYFNNR
jgi:hypothetical protein